MHCLRLCQSKHGGSPCHCDFVAWKHPVRINQLCYLAKYDSLALPRGSCSSSNQILHVLTWQVGGTAIATVLRCR